MAWRASSTYLFFLLLLRLTFYAERGHRTRFEPFVRNFFAATLADAVGIRGDSFQRLIDFLEQLLCTLLQSELKVRVDFSGRLVAQVRKCGKLRTIGQRLSSFLKLIQTLALKIFPNVLVFAASLRSLLRRDLRLDSLRF